MAYEIVDGRLFIIDSHTGRPWAQIEVNKLYMCGVCGETGDAAAIPHGTCKGKPCASCHTRVWFTKQRSIDTKKVCQDCYVTRTNSKAAVCDVCDVPTTNDALIPQKYEGVLGETHLFICPECLRTMTSRPQRKPLVERVRVWHLIVVSVPAIFEIVHILGVW